MNNKGHEVLDLFEYEDVLIVDREGVIIFDDLANPSLFDLRPEAIVGRKVTSLYKNLDDKTSTLMQVLRNGTSIRSFKQKLITKKGNTVYQISSTFPINDGEEVIGAVEFSRYLYTGDSINYVEKRSNNKIFRKNNTIYTIDDIITVDAKMLEIKERIRSVARTDSSVLIYGKTGTGKELVAQAIHNLSGRCGKPFISVNCAAIPGTLLESILFGTVKGSFTGAVDRRGLFEEAQGGTLFLDEISSMDTGTQVKLLKAIEEKAVRRVGGSRSIALDVRIISAMNENPEKALAKGTLREDLFYRLSIVQIDLPPLSERRADIKVLTEYFINYYNNIMNMQIKNISPEVLEAFCKYPWPGNVRELRNTVEAFYSSVNGMQQITLRDIGERIRSGNAGAPAADSGIAAIPLKEQVEEYERTIIRKALEQAGGNAAEAARRLGLSKQALKYKLDKYHIE